MQHSGEEVDLDPREGRHLKPCMTSVDQGDLDNSPLAGKDVKSPTVESLQGNRESGLAVQGQLRGKVWKLTLVQSWAESGVPVDPLRHSVTLWGKQLSMSVSAWSPNQGTTNSSL